MLFLLLAMGPLCWGQEDLYGLGMEQRKGGRVREARETFLKLLEREPENNGALEGLALTSLSLDEPAEARKHLLRLDSKKPGDPYILGLLTRADSALGLEDELLSDLRRLVAADPAGLRFRRRLDGLSSAEPGAFLDGRSYKSIGVEGLETGNPQRIEYQGRSGGARARARLAKGLDATFGYSVRQEAQKNHTGQFTYFDIREKGLSLGLEARPTPGLRCAADYGHSFLAGVGIGYREFSRARLAGEWSRDGVALRLAGQRQPKFLRGAGGTRFFALLRELSAGAEAEAYRWGWGFFLRGGFADYSDGITVRSHSFTVLKELGDHLFRGGFSHGQLETLGAGPDGRIRFVGQERWGSRYRYLKEEYARLEGGYAFSKLLDANRLHEADGTLALWLPFWREFAAEYRVEAWDFRGPVDGYRSTDWTQHWAGPHWRRGWGRGVWSHIAYEHAFARDSRGSYEANQSLAELECYLRDRASLLFSARGLRSSLRDDSFSLQLAGRWSF
ncbi:MAG: tetratricopeptide repeat protein [Elusimicrobiota bacterium]